MAGNPEVSIIIPHYLGDILLECLEAIHGRTSNVPIEVIVADDQPYQDGSLGRAVERFPDIRIVRTGGKAPKGLAAGCNRGLEAARGRYAVLLNNDVEVAPGWLPPLVSAADADEAIGVCQPKVMSFHERGRFDYGGAAGGMIDFLGYPFCVGRLFDTVERDVGQYDAPRDVFWAIGGALFLRMSCLKRCGFLDESFYMHMEEIDLCWRIQLAGFRVVSVPRSVVYHRGGWSLQAGSLRKAYFNHRNNLVMILKNRAMSRLVWVFPLRIAMELCTLVLAFIRLDWRHPLAAVAGIAWIASHPLDIGRRRREVQRRRTVPEGEVERRIYRGSVAYRYFVRGVRIVGELPGFGVG